MKIEYGKQIELKKLLKLNTIDIFLCANNHEDRSLSLYDVLRSQIEIRKAYAFCYEKDFLNVNAQGLQGVLVSDYYQIINLLDRLLIDLENKDSINIVVDYSCMTKPWYYTIVLYLKNRNINFNSINTFFSYTPALFVKPKPPKPNKEIGPLPGKYSIPTDKPKALIVGLGYEKNKAEGIIEHLEPKTSYLFYTSPASDPEFVKIVEKNNRILLEERSSNVIKYPFNNLLYLEKKLTNLCDQLSSEYSIIIAPLGPKPFTFISVMLSVKYNNIDIWRVGSGTDINRYNYKPLEDQNYIICNVLFEKN